MSNLRLILLKPTINQLRSMGFKDLVRLVIFLALLASPLLLFRMPLPEVASALRIDLPKLTAVILGLFGLSLASLSKPSYHRIAKLLEKDYHGLFQLVPARVGFFIQLSQLKRFLASTLTGVGLIVIYLLGSGSGLTNVLQVGLLMIGVALFARIWLIILPAILSFYVVRPGVAWLIKLMSLVVIGLAGYMFFDGTRLSLIPWPHQVFAKALAAFLTQDYHQFWLIFGGLIGYSLLGGIILSAVSPQLINYKLIYEAMISNSLIQSSVRKQFVAFLSLYRWLPARPRLIAAKESLQYFSEYSSLVVSLFNAGLMGLIMLVGRQAISYPIQLVLIISVTGYIAFFVGVTSYARDMTNLWVYQLGYRHWWSIAWAKYLSGIVNAFFTLLFFSPLLIGLFLWLKVPLKDSLAYFLNWELLLVIPYSLALGVLFSGILPVKFKGSDEKTNYTFSGLEGLFYLITMILVVAPILVAIDLQEPFFHGLVVIVISLVTVSAVGLLAHKLKQL